MKSTRHALSLAALFAFGALFMFSPQDADARRIRDGQGIFCTWKVVEGSSGTCVAYKLCGGVVKKRLPKAEGAPGYTDDGGESCVFSNGIVIEDGQTEEEFPHEEKEVDRGDEIAACVE